MWFYLHDLLSPAQALRGGCRAQFATPARTPNELAIMALLGKAAGETNQCSTMLTTAHLCTQAHLSCNGASFYIVALRKRCSQIIKCLWASRHETRSTPQGPSANLVQRADEQQEDAWRWTNNRRNMSVR